MAKLNLEHYRQAARELHKHLGAAEYRRFPIERAFIIWFIRARFGSAPVTSIVDGDNDGGIDAILEERGKTTIIQAKFEKVVRLDTVKRDEVSAFEQVADILTNPAKEEDFGDWADSVRNELRPIYEQLHRKALRSPADVKFIFATTKRFTLGEGPLVAVEDIQRISALWHLYSEGFTPPTESITLRLENSWEIASAENRFGTHVGVADVASFLALMDDDINERLFAQNVRTDLHSQTNKGIQRTYEQDPSTFWLGNNGVYIVCKEVEEKHGNHVLLFPSIINGSQTLHSIYHSKVRHPCKILVRILEMDGQQDPTLLSNVIRRANSRNPMKLMNLSAHDPLQLNLARYLDRYHIFYERREREWINEKKAKMPDYIALNIKDLAQWLSTLYLSIGFGRARAKISDLFQSTYYKRIFEGFDRDFTSKDYSSLAHLVWSGFVVKNLPRHLPASTRGFARTSHLLLMRATFDAIKQSPYLGKGIPQLLEAHKLGHSAIPNKVLKMYKVMIHTFLDLQKAEQRRDPSKDFSNFFKSDKLTQKAYHKGCSKRAIAALTKSLESTIQKFE